MENKSFFERKLKGSFCGLAVVLMAAMLVLSGFAGCASTQSISFTSAQLPAGELKYVELAAAAKSGMGTVLQRFYAQYPADKYVVVSCEKQSKDYLPVLAGLAGGALGAVIFLPIAFDSSDFGEGMAVAVAGVGFSVPIGTMIGTAYKDKWVIAYTER
ncbi:MAG: hypothetical protein MdMp014T_1039 [Treponematales bacterium]